MSIKTGIISPVVVSNSPVMMSLLLGYNRWSWGIYLEIFYGSVMSSKHLVHIWAIPVCVCLFRLPEWLTGWLFPLNTPWTTALIEPNNHHSVTTPPTFALCLLGLPVFPGRMHIKTGIHLAELSWFSTFFVKRRRRVLFRRSLRSFLRKTTHDRVYLL